MKGCHRTLSGTNFHHGVICGGRDYTNDFRKYILIGQKILPEALAGYVLHYWVMAICAAIAMASTMLLASAWPYPAAALSSAVP